jgi:hypothetical protein
MVHPHPLNFPVVAPLMVSSHIKLILFTIPTSPIRFNNFLYFVTPYIVVTSYIVTLVILAHLLGLCTPTHWDFLIPILCLITLHPPAFTLMGLPNYVIGLPAYALGLLDYALGLPDFDILDLFDYALGLPDFDIICPPDFTLLCLPDFALICLPNYAMNPLFIPC